MTPPEQHGGHGPPPQQQPGGEARGEVEREVHHPGRQAGAQALPQLLPRVLQAEHEQEQHHPDLGADVDEFLADVERQQPAVAERQPRQQIERDRREPPPARQPPQHRQPDDRRPQLDEYERDIVRRGSQTIKVSQFYAQPYWSIPKMEINIVPSPSPALC